MTLRRYRMKHRLSPLISKRGRAMSKHSKSKQALRYLGAQAAIALGVVVAYPVAATAAEPIFKCGKTYTNVPPSARPAQQRSEGCVLVDTAAQPKTKATNIAVDGSRQITVPVGQDGRFWVPGTVNGFPVRFVIDKAATVNAGVAVSEDFAARANLIGGSPAHMQAAGAVMDARRIERVPITFGPFSVPQATVVVGSLGRKSTDALLGQELLSLFDVTANDRELTIVGR
jgi:predicted aspartyl protease